MVKKKLETEEEVAVTSCDVHDVFQVLLLLLQLINCGDGGTKRLPFAEAYKIPLYLLQRVGEGRGRVGSANCNDKQHVFTFWGRQWQSMVMFMPTLSWGNRAGTGLQQKEERVQGGWGGLKSRFFAANCFQLCCMLLPFLWPVADVSPVWSCCLCCSCCCLWHVRVDDLCGE